MSDQYEKTKAERVARYKKEAENDSYPKVSKAMREYLIDPVSDVAGKILPSGRPQLWDKSDRDARKEVLGYSKGGSASKRADGIAQRVKTRGRMV